ncbi:MAG: hypothetical protein ACREJC_13005 [Tepidisphaeraceae bacterium]
MSGQDDVTARSRLIIAAIDPGSEQSGLVVLHGMRLLQHETISNSVMVALLEAQRVSLAVVLEQMHQTLPMTLVMEQIESFGKPVGRDIFDTVWWAGRFFQAWYPGVVEHLTRRAVKAHLCGPGPATDAHVRQVLIDRFGPGKTKAIGLKKLPGPLYGVTADQWSALALAVTWQDTHSPKKGRTTC